MHFGELLGFHIRFARSLFRKFRRLRTEELGQEFVRAAYVEISVVLRYLYLLLPVILLPLMTYDVYTYVYAGHANRWILVFDGVLLIAILAMLALLSMTPLRTGNLLRLRILCTLGAALLCVGGTVLSLLTLHIGRDLSIFAVSVLGVSILLRFPDRTRFGLYAVCFGLLYGFLFTSDIPLILLTQNSLFVFFLTIVFDRVSFFSIANNFLKTRRIMELNQLLIEEDLKKSDMIGIAVHDLKSPISGIAAASRLLKETLPQAMPATIPEEAGQSSSEIEATETSDDGQESISGDDRREILEEIEDSAHRLLGNVEQLVNLASLSAGEIRLRKEVFDLNEVIYGTVQNYSYQTGFKKIQIYTRFASENIELCSDRSLVSRVIDNLVSNAIKYSPHGGSVFIHARREEKGVRVEVLDEGPGFAAADRNRLFTPYPSVRPRFAREFPIPESAGPAEGGLGLYLARRLTTLLGGEIMLAGSVQDSEGRSASQTTSKGSRFVLQFPDLSPDRGS